MAEWSDDDVLRIVWRFEALAETASQIAMSVGTSRSAVLGLLKRIRDAVFVLEAAKVSDQARLLILTRVLGGVPAAQVARDLAAVCPGLTRHAVLLLVGQILRETALAGQDATERAGNRNRVAWPSWWTTQVVQRGRAA